MISPDERGFLARWTLANVIGWVIGLGLAVLLLGGGLLLRVWLPGWALVPMLPLAGALTGGMVGFTQRAALGGDEDDRYWIVASTVGGALGALPGGLLAALLAGTDTLLAQFAAGLGIAGGIGFGQAWQAVPNDSGRWQAVHRWALVNGVAGMLCAWIAPAGERFWLPLTCLLGTGIFGLITGSALVLVRRL